MDEILLRWSTRYSKLFKDYPEFREVSSRSLLTVYVGRNEQKLQQMITAALVCDDPSIYDERNIMSYSLEICNTPTAHNFLSNSPVSYGLMTIDSLRRFASNSHQSPLYKATVERLEQIYFTL